MTTIQEQVQKIEGKKQEAPVLSEVFGFVEDLMTPEELAEQGRSEAKKIEVKALVYVSCDADRLVASVDVDKRIGRYVHPHYVKALLRRIMNDFPETITIKPDGWHAFVFVREAADIEWFCKHVYANEEREQK